MNNLLYYQTYGQFNNYYFKMLYFCNHKKSALSVMTSTELFFKITIER